MADTHQLEEELTTGLKAAKGKRMYFAVVLKGGADGALILSKQKIPPGSIADAKKKSGGSAVIKGDCFGEDGKHVFEVAKGPPPTPARRCRRPRHSAAAPRRWPPPSRTIRTIPISKTAKVC